MVRVVSNQRRALGYGMLAVVLWSTVATAFKLSLRVVSVPVLLAGASIASTFILATVLAIQGRLLGAIIDLRRSLLVAFLQGMLNPIAYYAVLFEAYDRLPAQVVQPINYSWAIVLSLLAVPLLNQKLSGHGLGALAVGYAGVALVTFAGFRLEGSLDVLGLGLAVLSSVLWALYWVLGTRDHRPPVDGLFQNFLLSLPWIALWGIWQGSWQTSWYGSWQPAEAARALGAMAYVGAFEMGLSFVFWQLALKHSHNVAQTSSLVFLSPMLSLISIHYVLGERLHPLTFAGLGLILSGVVMSRSEAR